MSCPDLVHPPNIGVLPTVCSAKFGVTGALAIELEHRAEEVRRAIADWHAVRDPTPEQVASLRALCPPEDRSSTRDIDVAERVLRDQTLYARAIGYGTGAIAQRP